MSDELGKDILLDDSKEAEETTSQKDISRIIEWVNEIKDENTREHALAELSRKRESFSDLALYIWYSSGTVSSLLQEIINTYELLAPPKLNIQSSNRACNVLALFQCVAAHAETRPAFLNAQIPIFLYPFLNTVNKSKPFEYLRLTALGVIGALVKIDNSEVITFLLSTEIIPLCLRIMERGSELSKTVATFIVQRILLDDNGLSYVCNTAERFYAISTVLYNMINSSPSARLIKHIIRSYARLSDYPRVCSLLKDNLPAIFKDKIFYQGLDESSKRWIQNLMKQLSANEKQQQNNNNMCGHIQGRGGSSGGMNSMVLGNLNGLSSMGSMNAMSSLGQMSQVQVQVPGMGTMLNMNSLGNGSVGSMGAITGLNNNMNSLSSTLNPQGNFILQQPPSNEYGGYNMYNDNNFLDRSMGYGINSSTLGRTNNNMNSPFFSYKNLK